MRTLSFASAVFALFAGIVHAAPVLSGPPGDPFDRSLLRPRTQNLAALAGDTSLSITIDKAAFPLIRVYTDVLDENDYPVPGFQSEQFTVAQDGDQVPFSMVPVNDVGCPSSICLVIDVSLSMAGDPILAAREAAHQFVSRMGPFDRVAIVSFADCAVINAPFTSDRTILHAAIDGLVPVGLTASFDGIYQATELVAAEPGDRAVIAFSDGCDNNSASCWLPPDGWADGYHDDSALICDLATNAAVSIFTLTFGPLESTCLDPMEALALGTGGLYRHAPDAGIIDSVYAAIQEAVCSRYLISYRSSDTIPSFDPHQVEICLALDAAAYCDTMTYREPSSPHIALTHSTLLLGDTCQPSKTDLTIEAVVVDPGDSPIREVQLFYREASTLSAPYQSIPMSAAGDSLYTAVLPGSLWSDTAPGLEFFIGASDGDASVTLPIVNPHELPFGISFCPHEPPLIDDLSASCLDSGAVVSAVVRDSADGIARVVAIVASGGLSNTYDLFPTSGDSFSVIIPVIPQNQEVLISVRAWDNLGLARNTEPILFHCGPLPEDNWMTLTCSGPMFAGQYLATGDYIRVYDPHGVLVGRALVGSDSTFGTIRIFGDNPATPLQDEGADPGDRLSFTINALDVLLSPPAYFTRPGDTIEVCDRVACQDFSLDAGWHLISWNRAFSTRIDSLVTLLGGPACVDIIMAFDRHALTFDPDLPAYSTLHTADYYHAYWFRTTCPADFSICAGSIMDTDSLAVYRGYNLVPYWPDTALPIETAWRSILDLTNVALGFDHGSLIWLPDGGSSNTLSELAPGLGYWAHLAGDSYLIYPGWPQPASKSPTGRNPSFAEKVSPSQLWMSVYGTDLTIDGLPLPEGTAIEVRTTDSVLCGQTTYSGRILPFTPVYGASGSAPAAYPVVGDTLVVFVDGRPVFPHLLFQGVGNRAPLPAFTSTEPTGTVLLPAAYALRQNYPNPFNPQTIISFDLPKPGRISLTVYNILGQETATLADQWYPAGTHTVAWDGADNTGQPVASGVYLYRLKTDGAALTRKMLLMK